MVDLPPRSVAVVFGTRPEIIKLAHVIALLGPAARTIHTGQHYDEELGRTLLTELGVGAPAVQLDVGGASRGRQIGDALQRLDQHFDDDPPALVIVQGDTNTSAAGALAANAREVPLVHVEAGLRSHDRRMPEEHNRVIADHLADLCCAPTTVNRDNLRSEGVPDERIALTGNTVVEALLGLLPDAATRAATLAEDGLVAGGFVLATLHRPENVDDPERLATVLRELSALPLPVVLPLHPRTVARAERFGLAGKLDALRVSGPIGYRRFLALFAECALAVSDSGGVQEEASVLKRPVVIVRRSTERPEVLGSFAELVEPGPRIGEVARAWLDQLPAVHARLAGLPSPYGDGSASRRTLDAVADRLAALAS